MKRIIFIIVMIILIIGTGNVVFGEAEKRDVCTYYEEVYVTTGDTYWTIANKYSADNMSTKEYAEFIMDFNNAKNDNLKAGQKIIIPIIKYV